MTNHFNTPNNEKSDSTNVPFKRIRQPLPVMPQRTKTIQLSEGHECRSMMTRPLSAGRERTPMKTVIRQKPPMSGGIVFGIGSVLAGRYEILSEIAHGGFGVIYLAKQLGLDRLVAIKRLHEEHSDDAAARFLCEAGIIKSLIHPNTVELYDAGREDGHLYIVMEYIDGISLHTLIRRQSLDILDAVHIACQILRSIEEAHQHNIVHRDLKPSNIMLRQIAGDRYFVKVLDFGIARMPRTGGRRLTAAGTIMGTPQYLAPEVFNGTEAGPQADVFAIGLILAEMIMGRPVFPNGLKDILNIVGTPKPVPLPKTLMRTAVGHVLSRALCKDPEKRYACAGEMLVELQSVELHLAYHRDVLRKSGGVRFPLVYKLTIAAMLLILTNAIFIVFVFGN